MTIVQEKQTEMTFVPNSDIYEVENGWLIIADVPGVDENSIEVDLDKDYLKIVGKVEKLNAKEGYRILRSEYFQGNYERSFELNNNVDREGIEASVKNGVLRLFLPKAQNAKPTKIKVKSV